MDDDSSVEDDGEVRVKRVQLPGCAPFSTWNGTIATASGCASGRCSLQCESGDTVIIRALSGSHAQEAQSIQIEKIIPAPTANASSFCQCWSTDGHYLATAHDQRVQLYNARSDFALVATLQLRYSVVSMDLMLSQRVDADGDAGPEFLLVVGTAFGALLCKVQVSHDAQGTSSQDDECTRQSIRPPVLASVLPEIPVCAVKLSNDGHTLAIGSVDGRLFLRDLAPTQNSEAPPFGHQVFAKVLAAPRVTSMSFSPGNDTLVVATRKGNVYVLIRDEVRKWHLHAPCKELTVNPKPVSATSASGSSGDAAGATGGGNVATAMQTLVCWWGNLGSLTPSPVLAVGSRAANYNLEMVDVHSGKLLHSIQFAQSRNDVSLMATEDHHLLTGVCCLQLPNGKSALVCYDTGAYLSIITWPFLDALC
uniref:Anaphase-promoting complex subunit 4 WD40 domain-containing protein n=1 Tax=Globisporangium ultimum (strain ATCC 200006 / CBS 805.95 / DAOM BR144) TaxID=431595 RepID=K3WMB8_GLOUD